jgi:hypothetical protein
MLTMRHGRSAALVAASLAACACGGPQNQDNAAANAANAAQQQAVPQLPAPVLDQPLGREDLLLAAEHAASDFATGVDDSKRQKDLADKKFEFRIRFGCDGDSPNESAKAFDWSVNAKNGALKVRATPTVSTKDAPVKALAGTNFEAVEGFWVRRPWLLSATCPRQQPPLDAATPDSTATGSPPANEKLPAKSASQDTQAAVPVSAPSVGIAQFFTATDPRTLRRSGRPYEATKKLDEGDTPSGGFDLVLTGRLVALPDRRVIACAPGPPGERPSCVISVEFGRVSIERADTHEQLAQWGSG